MSHLSHSILRSIHHLTALNKNTSSNKIIMKWLHDFWTRRTDKYKISDCMVCTIVTSIECAPMLLPLKGFCRHTSTESFTGKPRFGERKHYKWISFGILVMMTLIFMWNMKVLVGNLKFYSKVRSLLVISDQLFSICGIILAATISLKWRGWMEILNGWCDIVDNRNDFGISNLSSASFCRTFTIRAIIIKVLLFLLYLLSCVLTVTILVFYRASFTEHFLLTEITVLFSGSVQFTATFINSYQLVVMRVMVKNAQKQLFANMDDPSNVVQDLEGFLRKYPKFFLEMANVYKKGGDVLNPGLLFWLALSVANMIVNVYLFIIQWENEYLWKISILEIRTFVLILVLGYLITLADTENIVSICYNIYKILLI